jgi:hypothetical protein
MTPIANANKKSNRRQKPHSEVIVMGEISDAKKAKGKKPNEKAISTTILMQQCRRP